MVAGTGAVDIATAISQQVPSVPRALAMLAEMETELTSASTYEQINKVVQKATALKILLGHVDEVKAKAEDTILVAKHRIGMELAKVPKATGKKSFHTGKV